MTKPTAVSGALIVIAKKIAAPTNILVTIDMWGSKGIEILANKKPKQAPMEKDGVSIPP